MSRKEGLHFCEKENGIANCEMCGIHYVKKCPEDFL